MNITPVNPKRTIYVGGLDDQVTQDLLRAAFVPFGDILQINLPADQQTQKHRGFAFIEFEAPEDALAAVDNMHNAELLGKFITCSVAKPTVSSKGKPIWMDDSFLQPGLEDSSKPNEKETTSSVVINAPKRAKTEPSKKLPDPPNGLKRCLGCGGFGVDLLKPSGYCGHCERTNNK